MKTPIKVRDFLLPLVAGCIGAEGFLRNGAARIILVAAAAIIYAVWLWRLRSRFKTVALLLIFAFAPWHVQAQEFPISKSDTNNLGLIGAAIIGGAVVIGGGAAYVWLKKQAQKLLNPPAPPVTNSPPVHIYPPGPPPPGQQSSQSVQFNLTNSVTGYDISETGLVGPDGEPYTRFIQFAMEYSTNLVNWVRVEVMRWDSSTCTTTTCNGVTMTVPSTEIPLVLFDDAPRPQVFYRSAQ